MYTRSWAPWAWGGGLALGCALYLRGFAVANMLMKIAPIRWVRHWLYNEMYFDELYFAVPVALTSALATFCGWLDRYVIDAGVELLTRATRALAYLSRLADRYLVDGLVQGTGALAQDLGVAARVPQSGRIRLYVTLLMGALTLAVAVAAR
jgi:NADH:ubiquinone oxidoreductase subunit 5 (subunit L)/multisubunit Na+/H+ antiporter MnhA subunit